MNDYERYGDYRQQRTEPSGGSNAGTALTFLLIGMGIGAAVAFLVTPMSGRELRNAVRQGCRNALDAITEQTRSLRERGSNLLGFKRGKAAGSQ
jgi:gas vesicle protein